MFYLDKQSLVRVTMDGKQSEILYEDLNTKQSDALNKKLAEASVTLLKNEANIITI